MRRLHWSLKLTLIAGITVVSLYAFWQWLPTAEWTMQWLQTLAPGDSTPATRAFLVYATVYIVATLVMFPLAPLAIGAGFVFGLTSGFIVTWLTATAGAVVAFYLSRSVMRDYFQRLIARRPALQAGERSVSEQGWLVVLLLRISPIIPSHLLNYICGITHMPAHHYALATLFGKAPFIFLLTYIGAAAARSFDAGASGDAMPVYLYAAGLAATLAAAWLVVRRARRELRQKGLDHD